jgi:hypothetical protein
MLDEDDKWHFYAADFSMKRENGTLPFVDVTPVSHKVIAPSKLRWALARLQFTNGNLTHNSSNSFIVIRITNTEKPFCRT